MIYNSDKEAIDALHKKNDELLNEIKKAIYGQDDIIKQVFLTKKLS